MIYWVAPFSLDLTNVEPDIIYCVDVYNITCGGRDLVSSDCSVTDTNYTSLSDGYLYEYIVTPRSNVEGAQNGTSQTILEKFATLTQSVQGYSVRVDNTAVPESEVDIQIPLQLNQSKGGVRADFYQISLYSADGNNISKEVVMENETSVLFELSLLYRKLWTYIVYAYDCREHPVLEATQLSTYDLQSTSITSPRPGEISVTGNIIANSNVTAVLVITFSNSEQFYHLIPRQPNGSYFEDILTSVAGGEYSVSLFLVENELPFNGAASWPQLVSVRTSTLNNKSADERPIMFEVQSNSTSACVTCTFMNDSLLQDCVAVVHQRISQLNSSAGLMNIESSRKFTRSGDTASGCIEGVNLEDSQIGVVGGKRIVSPTDPTDGPGSTTQKCNTPCISIIIVVIIVATVAAFAVMIFLLFRFRRTQRKRSPPSNHPSGIPLTVPENVCAAVGPGSDENTLVNGVTSSSGSSQQEQSDSGTLGQHSRSQETCTNSGYADVLDYKSNTAPSPVSDHTVIYHDINGFTNSEGQHYTMVSVSDNSDTATDDLHHVVYSEVKPSTDRSRLAAESSNGTQSEPVPTEQVSIPFDLEHLLSELMGVASKWKDLGEALLLDDDLLDEIYTNNETDEECLRDMLEKYLMRTDMSHSWEEMHAARRRMEENDTAHGSTGSVVCQETSRTDGLNDSSGLTHREQSLQADSQLTYQSDEEEDSHRSVSQETSHIADLRSLNENPLPDVMLCNEPYTFSRPMECPTILCEDEGAQEVSVPSTLECPLDKQPGGKFSLVSDIIDKPSPPTEVHLYKLLNHALVEPYSSNPPYANGGAVKVEERDTGKTDEPCSTAYYEQAKRFPQVVMKLNMYIKWC